MLRRVSNKSPGFCWLTGWLTFYCIAHEAQETFSYCLVELYITILIFSGVEGFIPSLEPLMMKEVLITEGNGLRIVGKDVKTYGCSNFKIFNMKLV